MRAVLMLTAGLLSLSAAAQAAETAPTLKANSYGRHLIQVEMARHPQLAAVTMHAAPPGSKASIVVASSTGELGKPASPDDLAVAAGGTPKTSAAKSGGLVVLEPLKDVDGSTIGALELTFKPGGDKAKTSAEAAAIRDHLAHRTAHAGNLLDPWPYDPHFNDRTAAQALVDKTMAAHPDVIILAIHATPPGSKTNVILGSNIGRIGKPADEDDLRVIEKGSINREVNETGRRFEAEIPLNDAAGKRIGALGVVFAYHAGEDKEALVRKAETIRDEIARHIPSPAALVRKAS